MNSTAVAAGLALAAGAAAAFQIGIQAQLGSRVGAVESAVVATWVGSAVTASVLLLVHHGIGGFKNIGDVRWWMFFGGVLGSLYIFSIAVAGAKIGVVATVALFLTSQLTVATLIDGFGWLRAVRVEVTSVRVVGLVFLAVGALMALRR